ncbi:MAG TPA: hypothetical protein VJ783_18015, partial [Pirellulales bacterium]|nr:hypothetical protein [Pirellulales bacterium]
ALVVAAVFVFRRSHPEWPRPYRVTGYPITPAIYLLGVSAALASMVYQGWMQPAAGTALILSGAVFYYRRVQGAEKGVRGRRSGGREE